MKNYLFKYKNKIKIYYWLRLIYEIGRTLPHSILIIFLSLKFDLASQDILIWQIMFYLPIFLFEIISGFISDVFSRKYIYLLSIALMITSFSMIGFSNYLYLIFIGQFIYGLGIALFTGTIDILFLNKIKKMGDKEKTKQFLSNSSSFSLIGMLIGGAAGGFLFQFINNQIYLISISLFLLVFLISLFFVHEKRDKIKFNFKAEITKLKLSNKRIIKNSKMRNAFLLIIITVSLILPNFYNIWPQLYIVNEAKIEHMGIFYAVFHFFSILGVFMYKKTKEKQRKYFGYISFLLFSLIFIISLIYLKNYAFIIIFPFSMIFFEYYKIYKMNILMENISKKNGGSQLSIISTFFNLFAILSLGFGALLLNYVNNHGLLIILASISLFFVIMNLIWKYFNLQHVRAK